jgi:hypothetical protein
VYENIYEYTKKTEMIGIRLCFLKESPIWKTNSIYPLYPWNELMQKYNLK